VNDIPVKKMELKRKTVDVIEDEMEDVDPGGRNVRCVVVCILPLGIDGLPACVTEETIPDRFVLSQ
jgi:hypothetical protein